MDIHMEHVHRESEDYVRNDPVTARDWHWTTLEEGSVFLPFTGRIKTAKICSGGSGTIACIRACYSGHQSTALDIVKDSR